MQSTNGLEILDVYDTIYRNTKEWERGRAKGAMDKCPNCGCHQNGAGTKYHCPSCGYLELSD